MRLLCRCDSRARPIFTRVCATRKAAAASPPISLNSTPVVRARGSRTNSSTRASNASFGRTTLASRRDGRRALTWKRDPRWAGQSLASLPRPRDACRDIYPVGNVEGAEPKRLVEAVSAEDGGAQPHPVQPESGTGLRDATGRERARRVDEGLSDGSRRYLDGGRRFSP